MKKPRFNSVDWEYINAYGHGYAIGRQGFRFTDLQLWGDDEKGGFYERQGWSDGFGNYCMFGEMNGVEATEDDYEGVRNEPSR